MRPKLREQLARQKGRPRSSNKYWGRLNGIQVPWTIWQRVWMKEKIRNSINSMMLSVMSQPRNNTIIMSADAYAAYEEELNQHTTGKA